MNRDKKYRYADGGKAKESPPHITPNVPVSDFNKCHCATLFVIVYHIKAPSCKLEMRN
jgi:hypothetical protein